MTKARELARFANDAEDGSVSFTNLIATGTVGIGTTPESGFKLDVSGGAMRLAGGDFYLEKEGTFLQSLQFSWRDHPGVHTSNVNYAARGTKATPAAMQSGDNLYALQVLGHDGTTYRGGSALQVFVDGAVSSGVVPTSLRFYTNAAATPAERMRITSAGNVGIGTSSPSDKLTVLGNVRADGGGTIDPEFRLSGASSGVSRIYALGTDSSQRLYWYDYTASAYRMVINSSGNVGIGTDLPSSVSGYRALNIKSASGGELQLGNTAGTAQATIWSDANGFTFNNHAATSQIWTIGGTERMRLDSSGNLGLSATPSAWGTFWKAIESTTASGLAVVNTNTNPVMIGSNFYYQNAGFTAYYTSNGSASRYEAGNGAHRWFIAPGGTAGAAISFTQVMTLDADGDLGVGTTNPVINSSGRTVHVNAPAGQWSLFHATNGDTGSGAADGLIVGVINTDGYVFNYEASSLVFGTSSAERARITPDGSFLVSKSSAFIGDIGFMVQPTGLVFTTISSGSNTYHVYSGTSSSYRFYVSENGGIYNFSGNNSNLSDERTKKNIELSGSYLEKICAIPIKLFNYKDEVEGEQRTLGVIAQDVEAIAPEFVNNSGWEGTSPEDGVPLKALYTTDMMFGIMKALQELKAEFDAYKAAHP